MKNLSFVLWVIFWPVADTVASYLDFLIHGKCEDEMVYLVAAFISLVLWISIAALVYEKKGESCQK